VRDLQKQRRVTTLISSHNLAEIQELCDHVAILDKGQLKISGPVDTILRQARQLEIETSRPLAADERERLAQLPGVRAVEDRGPQRYRLQLDLPDGMVADALVAAMLRSLLDAGVTPRALSQGNSLEEFFLTVTGTSHQTGN
jgi:ABC-2 type transport system ATP-binding protein